MSGPDVRPAMDPLEALLHRCHRAELLPLAVDEDEIDALADDSI